MDETDRRLVGLLRRDSRAPASTLAATLKVSRATVQNRIARLVRTGAIRGFTLSLGADAEGTAVRAVTLVEIEGKTVAPILKALRDLPEVGALHTTNGRWDVVAELTAPSLAALDQALRHIRAVDGISNTETSILLSTEGF